MVEKKERKKKKKTYGRERKKCRLRIWWERKDETYNFASVAMLTKVDIVFFFFHKPFSFFPFQSLHICTWLNFAILSSFCPQNTFNPSISYLQFSSVAASVVRNCLKPELKAAAAKRVESNLKVRSWESGKPSTTTSTLPWVETRMLIVIREKELEKKFGRRR